ncbi:hypothetical protein F5Y13DRAFT_81284 [Hypoxylon sp. FL1857]|nr:hypothetical protein F5Y13DRAFT_81284 [Hypoxylon sp. FL1857]
MAAAVQVMHSSGSSNHQQEPSTALVLEFACLFTHDLRRKQKRWQDGRLKYHTFNKRIMVYDERGNFVGDTHWREDYDLNEGDEVELERGGVIVQVADCTGSRDQDLSELIDKRAQERAERQAAALARRQPTLEAATTPHAATPHFQLRHKPLHHLIGTPTGHHGRAFIPTESPYEERQKLAVSPQTDSPRPAKRRKREVSPPSKGGYAQSLFGAALTLSGTPASSPLMRNRPIRASPVVVDSQSLAAPEPDQNLNSDSASTATRITAISTQKEAHFNAPKTTIPTRMSRASTTLAQSVVQPQSPMGSETSPGGSRRPGPTREEDSRGHAMEDDSLRPLSANITSRVPGQNKVNSRLREEIHAPRDASSTVALASNRIGSSSSALGSKTSVQSQCLTLEPELKNKANSLDSTEKHQKPAQEQSISEPKIELRIRPRKKRGLLMISESLDTRNSSPSRRTKSQTSRQIPPTSLGDVIIGDSNYGVYEDESIDTEARGTGHPKQKERSTIELRKTTASDAELDLSCNAPSLKSKSKTGRYIETRKGRREHAGAEEIRDGLDIPSLAIHEESPEEIEPRAGHSGVDDMGTIVHDPPCEDAMVVETTISSRSKKQPTKKKKRAPTEEITDPCSTEKYGESQGESEFTWPDGVPAPRLAQLGRKSIRSREVIGFNFDEEMDRHSGFPRIESGNGGSKSGTASDLTANQSMAHSVTSEANRLNIATTNNDQTGNNNRLHDHQPAKKLRILDADTTSKPIECRKITASHIGTTSPLPEEQTRSASAQINGDLDAQVQAPEETRATREPSAKKVINPATRGRKAAKPSDAAGQVPQCPLPSEAAVGKPLELGKHENNRRKSRQDTRATEATITPMPGFARANGGPWSREAHDLFEFTRPP